MRTIAQTFVFVWLMVGQTAWAETIHLTTHNLVPYSYYDESGDFTGVAFEAVHCALSKLDYDIRLSVVPWQRAQNMVKSGQADGFFAGSQKDERDQYAVMTAPIADQNWAWFWRSERSIDPELLNQNTHFSRSSFLGANMQSWLIENDYKTPSVQPATTEQLVDMVKYGRVEIGLANQAVLDHYLSASGQDTLFTIRVAQEKPLGLYLRKPWIEAHPSFLQRFNQAIAICRQ